MKTVCYQRHAQTQPWSLRPPGYFQGPRLAPLQNVNLHALIRRLSHPPVLRPPRQSEGRDLVLGTTVG